jgi:hypothetical protein
MITVATFDNQADAHIAKGRLEAEGLSPVLGDSHLVQTDWLYSAALGGIKLQVPESEAESARRILAQDRSEELEDLADWADAPPEAGGTALPAYPSAYRWAVLTHAAALAGAIVPFGHLLGPTAVWLWRRADSPAVERAGREAVAFQLSVTLYALLLVVLLPSGAGRAGLVLLFSLDLILVLVAAARTRRGEDFRYPLSLRLLG